MVLADDHLLEEFDGVVLNIPRLHLLLLENSKLQPALVVLFIRQHAEPDLVIFCLRDNLKAYRAHLRKADVYDFV